MTFVLLYLKFVHICTNLRNLNWTFLNGTPGNRLVSHLVVDKLPSSFLRELKIDTREEYPSVNILFERYHSVLKTSEKFQKRNVSYSSASASSKSVKDSKPSSPRTDKKYSSFTAASSKKREHK